MLRPLLRVGNAIDISNTSVVKGIQLLFLLLKDPTFCSIKRQDTSIINLFVVSLEFLSRKTTLLKALKSFDA